MKNKDKSKITLSLGIILIVIYLIIFIINKTTSVKEGLKTDQDLYNELKDYVYKSHDGKYPDFKTIQNKDDERGKYYRQALNLNEVNLWEDVIKIYKPDSFNERKKDENIVKNLKFYRVRFTSRDKYIYMKIIKHSPYHFMIFLFKSETGSENNSELYAILFPGAFEGYLSILDSSIYIDNFKENFHKLFMRDDKLTITIRSNEITNPNYNIISPYKYTEISRGSIKNRINDYNLKLNNGKRVSDDTVDLDRDVNWNLDVWDPIPKSKRFLRRGDSIFIGENIETMNKNYDAKQKERENEKDEGDSNDAKMMNLINITASVMLIVGSVGLIFYLYCCIKFVSNPIEFLGVTACFIFIGFIIASIIFLIGYATMPSKK